MDITLGRHGALVPLRRQQGPVWSARSYCRAARRPRVAARASGSELGRIAGAELLRLQAALDVAVSSEDYAAAARLRDEIRQLDPSAQAAATIAAARQELQGAVEEERFEEATQLRDRLRDLLGGQLLQQLPAAVGAPQSGCPPTTSETLTENGIRVTANSAYVMSCGSQHLFSYTIRVSNEGPAAVQLRSYDWQITDGEGKRQDGRGSGIGSGQRLLLPGQSVEYQSTCPLGTEVGCMEGHVECVAQPPVGSGAPGQAFVADIARFGLNGLRASPKRRPRRSDDGGRRRRRFWEELEF